MTELEQLYRAYFSDVYLYLKRLTGDETLAEDTAADPAPGPQAAAERRSETLRLHRLVHALPEPYKEVFLLRVFGELDYKQIGAVFGKTANWACVTYCRAR